MALYSRDRLSTISTGTFGTPPLYVNHSVNSTNTRGAQYNPSNHTSTMEEKIKRAKAKKAHQIYMENPLKYEGKPQSHQSNPLSKIGATSFYLPNYYFTLFIEENIVVSYSQTRETHLGVLGLLFITLCKTLLLFVMSFNE